jgi:ATP-binding cassette subfamily B multidrug efflux pump
VDAFLALTPSIENHPTFAGDNEAKEPLIRFEDVALSYGQKGDKPAVEHLSFSIQKGSWVGLIGGTGSGKSTTLALLERLYEPSAGKIYYRGEELSRYDLDKLHEEISFVSQKPALFKGTIESNLRLAKPNATEEELLAALKESLAYEYVQKFPEGLAHPVEEGGANLSGGQKQRLLIARALLKGGDILILDDSTSALDYLSDLQVRRNIASHPGLTKILVSQRASTLKDCDLILVYDNGRILDQGTNAELLSRCSVYKDIVEMQKAQA